MTTIDFSNPHWDGHGKLYPGTIRVLSTRDFQPHIGMGRCHHLMPLPMALQDGLPHALAPNHARRVMSSVNRACPYRPQMATHILTAMFQAKMVDDYHRHMARQSVDLPTPGHAEHLED